VSLGAGLLPPLPLAGLCLFRRLLCFPLLLNAVKTYATLGGICGALRGVWGAYRETAVL
jgi:hypothetical protein